METQRYLRPKSWSTPMYPNPDIAWRHNTTRPENKIVAAIGGLRGTGSVTVIKSVKEGVNTVTSHAGDENEGTKVKEESL